MQTNDCRYRRVFLRPEKDEIYLDNNPTKLPIHSDHTHIFDTVHVDTCDETCAVEDIVGTITLDTSGSDSGCNLEQCCMLFYGSPFV